jgi:hypothetical protein
VKEENDAASSPNEETQRFAKVRETSLLIKWSRGGRLSRTEFEEIRHRLPVGSTLDNETPALNLDESGRARYKKELVHYESIYNTKVRQLKKYIAVGKAAKPPELPPLDQPPEMPGWWARHMKQRVPPRLLALAATRQPEENDEAGIDVGKLSGDVGDAVRRARVFLEAADRQLSEAYDSGVDSKIEVKQRRWLKALEALRKAEAAEREDRKASDELIPRVELLPELSQLLEVLRHMRSTMKRRIIARIGIMPPDFPADFTDRLSVAIEIERANEDAVLRRLKQFRSVEEIDAFQLEHADTE